MIGVVGYKVKMRGDGDSINIKALPDAIFDFYDRLLDHQSKTDVDLDIHFILELDEEFTILFVLLAEFLGD